MREGSIRPRIEINFSKSRFEEFASFADAAGEKLLSCLNYSSRTVPFA